MSPHDFLSFTTKWFVPVMAKFRCEMLHGLKDKYNIWILQVFLTFFSFFEEPTVQGKVVSDVY